MYATSFPLGTAVAAALSNHATALLLTPVVAALVLHLDLAPRPYLFTTTFTADTASFQLPVSDPIHVPLLGERTALTLFLRYLLLPSLVAVLVNALVFFWWVRRDLRGGFAGERLTGVGSSRSPATVRMLGALALHAVACVAAGVVTLSPRARRAGWRTRARAGGALVRCLGWEGAPRRDFSVALRFPH